jgi:hypothetical protein
VIDLLFGLVAAHWVPWALSVLIVATAVIVWLDFRWRRLEPVLVGLDQAIAAIEETEGQGAFRQRFAALFQRLADNPVTGDTWRAYASTLAPSPTNDNAIGYTRRPAENFNEGVLAVAGINLRFYHAMPNLLVGVGLLFTFIGLVAALYFASAGVAASDVRLAQAALRELLGAATFKFATSIAGLGSSLIFSWREKAHLYRVHKRLARLCAALEARMIPVTTETLAAAQLLELKSQTGLLKRLSRDIFIRLPEAVEERLAADLAAGVAPVRQALAAAAERLAQLDAAALASVWSAREARPDAAASRPAPAERSAEAVEPPVEPRAAVDEAGGSAAHGPAPEPAGLRGLVRSGERTATTLAALRAALTRSPAADDEPAAGSRP